jgi:alpha-methylacyl-CoA racemase
MDVPSLEDVRVLDLSRAFPGGYCTLLLAQLGAEVIKVEAPGTGDPLRGGQSVPTPGHVGLNRGKRSITLDTRAAGAPAVLRRLVTHADVLVESAPPGVMSAAGFGPDDGLAANPQLVWASITGFGGDGPYAGRPGHEVTFLGQSGLLSVLGDGQPWMPQAMVSVPVGGLSAAFGIVAALLGRSLHGRGTVVDAAIADASTWLLGGMPETPDHGPVTIGWTAGRRLYRCADGGFVTTAAAEPRTWQALCERLGTPEFVERLGDDDAGQVEMADRFEEIFSGRSASEWVAELGDATVGAVNEGLGGVARDPHGVARGVVEQVAGYLVPGPAVRVGTGADAATAPPPALGADTDAVLLDAGFDIDEIAALRADGTV